MCLNAGLYDNSVFKWVMGIFDLHNYTQYLLKNWTAVQNSDTNTDNALLPSSFIIDQFTVFKF